jgi:FkbM family methyltransferase
MKWYRTDTFLHLRGIFRGIKRVCIRALYNGLGLTQAYGLKIRPHTTDLWTVMETFERQVYLPLCSQPEAKVIVDLGANIGDSAVYFAQRYPRAKIIAIECEESNFQLLLANVKAFPNVTPVHAAIWSGNEKLSLTLGSGKNATRVSDQVDAGPSVNGLTMGELMATHNIEKIDILKIDIEGAEKNLFEHNCAWLADVQIVGIEMHDHLIAGCTAKFFASMANNFNGNYSLSQLGETLVVNRLPARPGIGRE